MNGRSFVYTHWKKKDQLKTVRTTRHHIQVLHHDRILGREKNRFPKRKAA